MFWSVSILIPTYNRASVLCEALESLRSITLPDNCRVELIVIANACTDGTPSMVQQLSAGMPFPMRCVEESCAGLSHARNRAVREATGDILAFLDDDVAVDKDWLVGLLDVFESQYADIVAGKVTLSWRDVDRPNWMTTRSEHLLSCTDYGYEVRELRKAGLAVGANFAFHVRVAAAIGPFFSHMGHLGLPTLRGDETHFIGRALRSGYRMFCAPRASLIHYVSKERITPSYLCKVAFSNGVARPFLNPKLDVGAVLYLLLKNALRVLAYLLLETASFILLQRRSYIHHRIRRNSSAGTVLGAIRYLQLLRRDALPSVPLVPARQARANPSPSESADDHDNSSLHHSRLDLLKELPAD